MNKNVYVVGGDNGVANMFDEEEGYDVILNPGSHTIDLVVFTGGADVSPSLYNDVKHPTSRCNLGRDIEELGVFHDAYKLKKVGICRGSQFLNVASGGQMWQDVDNHLGNHLIHVSDNSLCDALTKQVEVTSTHHQMMRPSDRGEYIGFAERATYKCTGTEMKKMDRAGIPVELDAEIILYKHSNSLCFQPHPEYVGKDHECRRLFFKLLDAHMNGDY